MPPNQGNSAPFSSIPVSVGRLRLSREMQTHEAPQLRAFFGNKFADDVLAHNHGKDVDLIHQYPTIQFKVIQSTAVLLGIGAGSELLKRLWLEIDQKTLGDEQVDVVDAHLETYEEEMTSSEQPISYRFLTPWLALNEKNFRSYTGSRNTAFRKDELSRILVGNCLGMAKSLGVRFPNHIQADGRQLASIKTTLRGKGMIGFIGRFRINARLPELIGLGKSAARGFGAISSDRA